MADAATLKESLNAAQGDERPHGAAHRDSRRGLRNTRSRLCQEGLCCQGGSAEFFCSDCGLLQCSKCEALLHSSREYKAHSRERLGGGARRCELWCDPRRAVALRCRQCGMEMCRECDARLHQGQRKDHYREELGRKPSSGGGVEVEKKVGQSAQDSFLLVNEKEEMMVSDVGEFVRCLGCSPEAKVKVVSIFGNTGDGKSHTLNHTFFRGQEVFSTSSRQSSCTVGIWAAYSPNHNTIFLDTEGMLGVSQNENRRTRLLLKVLAISDIVIYRSRAERLHNDLFTFLGDASNAYWKYFTPELKAASDRCKLNVPLSTLGPSVIIFHETQHTELLGEGVESPRRTSKTLPHATVNVVEREGDTRDSTRVSSKSCNSEGMGRENRAAGDEYSRTLHQDDGDTATGMSEGSPIPSPSSSTATPGPPCPPMSAEELLRIRFAELGRIPKAFCSVEYVGTRTRWPPTDFSGLQKSVVNMLRNKAVRAPRQPDIVLKALQVLNEKFSGDIESSRSDTFPDAYFSCPENCFACGVRCELSMNHGMDSVPHKISGVRCRYSHQYDNKIFLCKTCFNRGVESVVVPKTSASGETGWMGLAKYAWAGYVIECRNCGEIYRSRKHWYGNKNPEETVVKTENKHIWPEDLPTAGQGCDTTARRLLDGVGSVAEAVGGVSARPTSMVYSWVADQIAPAYWVPNSKITVCGECNTEFAPTETKHHCRSCGGGFCEKCSSKVMPVPWRGWGHVPVRVCTSCYKRYHGGDKREKRRGDRSQEKQRTAPEGGKPVETKVTARYVSEVVQSAMGVVSSAMDYPRGVVVESARPVYWVTDANIKRCHKCKREFGVKDSKHHCRACGQGFCGQCSSQQRAVPSRGWDYPVRVCDDCAKRKDL